MTSVTHQICTSKTEKCQFKTEKCQFKTEKCQFSAAARSRQFPVHHSSTSKSVLEMYLKTVLRNVSVASESQTEVRPGAEKCQFRTEKCQFRTEKCQFRTEKCQFRTLPAGGLHRRFVAMHLRARALAGSGARCLHSAFAQLATICSCLSLQYSTRIFVL